ncbi:MAG: hypothetical protein M1827_006919 [Pycnora praestabilis]|nr:MAG: hypothetical protein M1827_006919 [Pycnora praestabilis]
MRRTMTAASRRLQASLNQEIIPSPRSLLIATSHSWVCASCTRRVNAIPSRPATTQSSPPLKESLLPQTHYELFPQTLSSGPPPHGPFDIDVRQLRKEFLQLQARAHPDRHQGPAKHRAEGASALINEAYKVLQNPLLRAQYLLSLRGIDVAEDETATVEDPELLMEVLEMREQIEAAEAEEDLVEMRRLNDGRIEGSVGVLEDSFRRDDVGRAKEEAVRLRYWINIKESLDAWEKGKPVILVH